MGLTSEPFVRIVPSIGALIGDGDIPVGFPRPATNFAEIAYLRVNRSKVNKLLHKNPLKSQKKFGKQEYFDYLFTHLPMSDPH